jgi:hypothetical protein
MLHCSAVKKIEKMGGGGGTYTEFHHSQIKKCGRYRQKLIYALKLSINVTGLIFMKLKLTQKLNLKNCCNKLHKNMTNGLVTASQNDGQAGTVSTSVVRLYTL